MNNQRKGLICRNLHHAYLRVREGDYSLSGLVGFELRTKVVGVVGTGAIGLAACQILRVRGSPLALALMTIPVHYVLSLPCSRLLLRPPGSAKSCLHEAQSQPWVCLQLTPAYVHMISHALLSPVMPSDLQGYGRRVLPCDIHGAQGRCA